MSGSRIVIAGRWIMAGVALFAGLALSAPVRAADETPLHAALGLPDELTMRVGFRVRTEALGGQFRPVGPRHDQFVSFRTDLYLEYQHDRLRLVGELRDARGYGERHGSTVGPSDINTLEPLQASIGLDLKDVGGKGAGGVLAVGRYTLETGAGRLIGRPDFANSVNSYTGGLLDWHNRAKDRLILFAAEPSIRLPNDPEGLRHNRAHLDRAGDGLRFFGADFTKAALLPGVLAEAYLYRLAERDTDSLLTRNRHISTYGLRIQRPAQKGRIDFEVEAAHQDGRAHATTAASDRRALPVSAQLIHAEIGRKFGGAWKPRVSLHGDIATGDDADPDRYTRFDPLFGAARADFGPTGLFGAVTRANLRSVGVRLEATPGPRLDMFAMLRPLWLDATTDSFATTSVRDRRGASGRYAGTQVEARVRYWLIPKRLKADVGGAYLAKGRFLRNAPNAPRTGDSRYLFVDLALDV